VRRTGTQGICNYEIFEYLFLWVSEDNHELPCELSGALSVALSAYFCLLVTLCQSGGSKCHQKRESGSETERTRISCRPRSRLHFSQITWLSAHRWIGGRPNVIHFIARGDAAIAEMMSYILYSTVLEKTTRFKFEFELYCLHIPVYPGRTFFRESSIPLHNRRIPFVYSCLGARPVDIREYILGYNTSKWTLWHK
jgi:hypothetical protein